MNQALIAAMAGTGIARDRETVNRAQLHGILHGWLIGPAAGFILAYLVSSWIAETAPALDGASPCAYASDAYGDICGVLR